MNQKISIDDFLYLKNFKHLLEPILDNLTETRAKQLRDDQQSKARDLSEKTKALEDRVTKMGLDTSKFKSNKELHDYFRKIETQQTGHMTPAPLLQDIPQNPLISFGHSYQPLRKKKRTPSKKIDLTDLKSKFHPIRLLLHQKILTRKESTGPSILNTKAYFFPPKNIGQSSGLILTTYQKIAVKKF